MSDDSASTLKKTPLHSRHVALGARLVPFSGWEMPVQYAGILEEHKAVRQRAGLFDVSHMGRFEFGGPTALSDLETLTSNKVSALAIGQVQYSALCLPSGGLRDDILVLRRGDERFDMVVNAGNLDADRDWIRGRLSPSTTFVDASVDHGIIALQGPRALAILRGIAPDLDPALGYYHCAEISIAGRKLLASRTGYTGEDGFELYPDHGSLGSVWDALIEAGRPEGLAPCGLGARDTLRLESGYSLYGHELSEDVSLLESGLGWICDLGKEFIGAEALRAQKAAGVPRTIVGLKPLGRTIPRQGYSVLLEGRPIGVVTSGTQSPTFGFGIAMALVETGLLKKGTRCSIEVRGRQEEAEVVDRRFHRKAD